MSTESADHTEARSVAIIADTLYSVSGPPISCFFGHAIVVRWSFWPREYIEIGQVIHVARWVGTYASDSLVDSMTFTRVALSVHFVGTPLRQDGHELDRTALSLAEERGLSC